MVTSTHWIGRLTQPVNHHVGQQRLWLENFTMPYGHSLDSCIAKNREAKPPEGKATTRCVFLTDCQKQSINPDPSEAEKYPQRHDTIAHLNRSLGHLMMSIKAKLESARSHHRGDVKRKTKKIT